MRLSAADPEGAVLTEDAVINLLCEHLTADGWKIVSKALPDQRGT